MATKIEKIAAAFRVEGAESRIWKNRRVYVMHHGRQLGYVELDNAGEVVIEEGARRRGWMRAIAAAAIAPPKPSSKPPGPKLQPWPPGTRYPSAKAIAKKIDAYNPKALITDRLSARLWKGGKFERVYVQTGAPGAYRELGFLQLKPKRFWSATVSGPIVYKVQAAAAMDARWEPVRQTAPKAKRGIFFSAKPKAKAKAKPKAKARTKATGYDVETCVVARSKHKTASSARDAAKGKKGTRIRNRATGRFVAK